MSRFYFREIAVSGANVEYSMVTLTPFLNIMHEPSNTGMWLDV